MAYMRYRRRYTRRRPTVKRSYRRRSYGRRRTYRRKRRYVRKIAGVSPYKQKRDTLVAAHNTNSEPTAPISNGDFNTFFAFTPTYLPISLKPEPANAHERDSDVWRIAFRGYKERSLITATRSIIWRRIVLWSYTRFSDAMPPLKGTGAASYYARQITPLTNSAELRGFLFRGEQGIDYTPSTIHQAALNTTNFTVVMDRVVTVNPNFDSSDNPKVFERKDWIPGGKIVYPYNESGTGVTTAAGWSSLSRESRGNMYVFDVFNTPGNTTAAGTFQPQAIRYWYEG